LDAEDLWEVLSVQNMLVKIHVLFGTVEVHGFDFFVHFYSLLFKDFFVPGLSSGDGEVGQ
jgi:hypothetical protein